MRPRPILILALSTFVLAGAGCCHWRDRPPERNYNGGWSPPPGPNAPAVPAPPGGNPEILTPQGNGIPTLPPPSSSRFAPPGWNTPANVPPDLLPPTNVPIDYRQYNSQRLPTGDTAEPPLAPRNPFAGQRDSGQAPFPLPPDLRDPNGPERIAAPRPEIRDEIASPAFPVGIARFAEVKAGVASGDRPQPPEGLEWLKANRYQTVLHIRKPGPASTADREQAEKRGLKYLFLVVSPETLAAKMADFNTMIADAGIRPLFVYDSDGTLTGALWYLHLRSVEKMPPEAARLRARSLGLKDESTGEHAALWIAIQQVPLP
ncbi:MAG: hypothetical protein ACJ8F7_11020 [Gemmataceae bacterium]